MVWQLAAPHLYGAVGIQEEVPAADAAVDAAQSHVEAEGEEVALVEVANAVVEPSWEHVELGVQMIGSFVSL